MLTAIFNIHVLSSGRVSLPSISMVYCNEKFMGYFEESMGAEGRLQEGLWSLSFQIFN
ncbi:hypothetical protein JYU34_022526 [Plutella xylostella]|uniref:Uncharacterized protein n=1 Tax=Plutella xylostella TaxID=51655 RepID=A0ABQ7PPZ0_PLUXY|nr:hypothetical protein JYU34_022526 [Plutella xylostella]